VAKSRNRYHHGDLPRALREATLALVTEQGGAGGVTLRQIAERAGVSHNAPYRHYSDKSDILAAIATEGFATLSSAMTAARNDVKDEKERFVRTGRAYLRFTQEHPGRSMVMFGHDVHKSRTPELQHAANATFQILKDLARDAGVTDLVKSRQAGVVVWSFLHGLGVLARNAQVPSSVGATPEALADLGLRQLFHALRTNVT
jgi:AcrR family transcriptional regulator